MKLLLDQGLPRDAAAILCQQGHDAEHVADIGMSRATDRDILHRAAEQKRVVITLDADFHALLAASGAAGPSVVRIRIDGLRGPQLVELLTVVFEACSRELVDGALVSVTSDRVRTHRLPIGQRADSV